MNHEEKPLNIYYVYFKVKILTIKLLLDFLFLFLAFHTY